MRRRQRLRCLTSSCWQERAASPTRSGSAISTRKSSPGTRCCAITPSASRRSRSTIRSIACRPRRCCRTGRTRSRLTLLSRSRRRAASPTRSACARLGVLLFQMPPYLKKELPRLTDFLGLLPAGLRAAFEFRNESWQSDDVYQALRARGAMLCVTDTDEGDTPFVVTSDWGYVRLRRTHYDDGDLRPWVERIAAQRLARTYVYFMHEDEALGTRFAQRLNELWRELPGSGAQ